MSSRYEGRHRQARHAAPKQSRLPKALSPAFVLPTSAAAALVLTATGASMAESANVSLSLSPAQAALIRAESTGEQTSAADLAGRRNDAAAATAAVAARVDQAEQASRGAAFRAVLAAAKAKVAAEELAKKEAQGKRWVLPLAKITGRGSGYGMRLHPILGYWKMHYGNDYSAPTGTPLRAMSKGTVILAGWQGGYGKKVEIRYWDGTVSYYGHMTSISVTVGETVYPGDVVGAVGSTGLSTGAHLHLEIHPDGGAAVNPGSWLADHGLVP